eukprot:3932599-Amphidinium_carterae.2
MAAAMDTQALLVRLLLHMPTLQRRVAENTERALAVYSLLPKQPRGAMESHKHYQPRSYEKGARAKELGCAMVSCKNHNHPKRPALLT